MSSKKKVLFFFYNRYSIFNLTTNDKVYIAEREDDAEEILTFLLYPEKEERTLPKR